ncbi:hypothetical protein KAR91_64475 [Candidatus Pacearchaeota archaeon]|nr:hypothetical protein [Candidatus Pacearchaeota archaeon]
MGILKKAWDFISGKKTVTAAILKGVADVCVAAGYVEVAQLIDQVGNFLLAAGLAHKGTKAIK